MTTTTEVNEKPIIFNSEMIRAILDGRKTQTRRVIKLKDGFCDPYWSEDNQEFLCYSEDDDGDKWGGHKLNCPYGKPGDELWVRETWKPIRQDPDDGEWTVEYKTGNKVNVGRMWPVEGHYKEIDLSERLAEEYEDKGYMPWKPSIHMPRGASRIQLLVTDVRVERVQDISNKDAQAEGVDDSLGKTIMTSKELFHELWDSINADRGYSWESNPWVWVIEFEVKEDK